MSKHRNVHVNPFLAEELPLHSLLMEEWVGKREEERGIMF